MLLSKRLQQRSHQQFILYALLSTLFLQACATSNSSLPKTSDQLAPNHGLLMVTTGRLSKRSLVQLPFTAFGIYQKGPLEDAKLVQIILGDQSRFSELGKGKYGFLHVRHMEQGSYYMVGQKGTGSALGIQSGRQIVFDDNGVPKGPVFEIEIIPGQVLYLGEILLTEYQFAPENFRISDQYERDAQLFSKRFKGLTDLPVTKAIVEQITYQPQGG